MPPKTWPRPKSRNVGLFTDLRLFSEALELTFEQGSVTKHYLQEELPQRVHGLLFVERQSSKSVEHLIRELRGFSWFHPVSGWSKSSDAASYRLTPDGEAAFNLFKQNSRDFLRLLTAKMQDLYTIPGWFVHRLWSINPEGQGDVVVPGPPRGWNPSSREWEDKDWTPGLTAQTKKSLEIIQNVCPGAFPIKEDDWIGDVKVAWDRLSSLKRRKVAKPSGESVGKEKGQIRTYTPRRRLALAMREAAVNFLFSNSPPYSDVEDFWMPKPPLLPRTYMAWCPRLEALELIFYTDVHPTVPGRLIFPTSVFRVSAPQNTFEKLSAVKNPDEESLWLHQPSWESMKDRFFEVLSQEHHRASARVGSLYVSLLDVRDEVCRQLRLSAARFDDFIEEALRESLRPESRWSISVETDIREDQRSAFQLIRRPVWIDGTPHSLIAITEIRDA